MIIFHHDNVLHKFASYNYIWTLSAISETEVRNPDTIKTVNDVWKFSKNMWRQAPTWYLVET